MNINITNRDWRILYYLINAEYDKAEQVLYSYRKSKSGNNVEREEICNMHHRHHITVDIDWDNWYKKQHDYIKQLRSLLKKLSKYKKNT